MNLDILYNTHIKDPLDHVLVPPALSDIIVYIITIKFAAFKKVFNFWQT